MEFDRLIPHVDPALCIGCGRCEESAPDLFRVGEFTAEPILAQVSGEQAAELMAAAEDCPFGAITFDLARTTSGDHDEERSDEEERGEIGEDNGEEGDTGNRDHLVEPENSERLERREDYFAVVRDRSDDDEHPRCVSGS